MPKVLYLFYTAQKWISAFSASDKTSLFETNSRRANPRKSRVNNARLFANVFLLLILTLFNKQCLFHNTVHSTTHTKLELQALPAPEKVFLKSKPVCPPLCSWIAYNARYIAYVHRQYTMYNTMYIIHRLCTSYPQHHFEQFDHLQSSWSFRHSIRNQIMDIFIVARLSNVDRQWVASNVTN